jgi:hypothetical protein
LFVGRVVVAVEDAVGRDAFSDGVLECHV